MDRFREIYRIDSTRRRGWDYRAAGKYFVTICTTGAIDWFGTIVHRKMLRNSLGDIAAQYFCEIPIHFRNASIDEFVVMPDHLHGIIVLSEWENKQSERDCRDIDNEAETLPRLKTRRDPLRCMVPSSARFDERSEARSSAGHATSLQISPNATSPRLSPKNQMMSQISPKPGSLSVIIRSYKSAVTRWSSLNGFDNFRWQSRYHDWIISDRRSLEDFRQYIKMNPERWRIGQ